MVSSNQVFSSGPFGFLAYHLFYFAATVLNWLIANPVIVIDVFGPLLLGLIAFMMYLYASRVLKWTGFKSFLVALFVGTYFVSLRNSWDLYAQSFALIFLLATLLVLNSSSSPKRYVYAFVLAILTVLSHELVAVILLFVLGLEVVRFLMKKRRNDFLNLLTIVCSIAALFLFTQFFPKGGLAIAIVSNASPSLASALYVGGFLVYCYIFILPLVILGFAFLKDWILRYWILLCVGITITVMIFPASPFYAYDRWVLLLVYPLMFFAVHGLEKLWHSMPHNVHKMSSVPKIVAVTYLVFLMVTSGFYLIAAPDAQFTYFSNDNNYLAFVQSGMYQNSAPISDNPSLVKCFEWIKSNDNSVVLMHYQLFNYAMIYLDNMTNPVIEITSSQQMVVEARAAIAGGHDAVYTVWWVKGEGWYSSFALPSQFIQVYRSGRMAVYLFNQTT